MAYSVHGEVSLNCFKEDDIMLESCFKRYGIKKSIYKPEIDHVIFNDKTTIVFWKDGSKTVVKCMDSDDFDYEKGVLIAFYQKVNEGVSKTELNKEFKKIVLDGCVKEKLTSYNQKRTVMFNYEVLANIYKWRKDHKLDEWRDLCKWITELPCSEIITGEEEK